MIVPARFNGPPGSGNGGWVAGALAARLDRPGAVTVTLSGPPPLDVDLDVVATDDGVQLEHGGRLLARAVPDADVPEPPAAVDVEAARAGRAHFLEFGDHPFTSCFVCGTDRPDGLHVFPGPVVTGAWDHVAATFSTTEFAAAPELLWAALDCPSGWAAGLAEAPALLGTYTVARVDAPEPGEPCVLVGVDDGPRGRSGRVHASRSAAYGADGRLLGHAAALWISPGTPG